MLHNPNPEQSLSIMAEAYVAIGKEKSINSMKNLSHSPEIIDHIYELP